MAVPGKTQPKTKKPMSLKRAIGIAIAAMSRDRQRYAFEAHLYEQGRAPTEPERSSMQKHAYEKYHAIGEAQEILAALVKGEA